MVLLTGHTVSQISSSSQVKFDLTNEGYLIGTSFLNFNIKENSGADNFYLDFCGDQIFEMIINGLSIPVDSINWTNNQILLTSLRGGTLL